MTDSIQLPMSDEEQARAAHRAYLANLDWHTASPNGNSCVEVAHDLDGGVVLVRDSKDQTGAVQMYNESEWVAFIRGARDGRFDFGLVPPRMIGLTTH